MTRSGCPLLKKKENHLMKCCVLFASPRPHGNTRALLEPFLAEWRGGGHEVREFSLYDLEIGPCRACLGCQKDWEHPACVIQDDMQEIFPAVLESDLILLASPVYSWYCTAPLKAALDRMVYALNKYYGGTTGPALWRGKRLALITTCGYPVDRGADLLSEGLRRYAKHSGLIYLGALAERHRNLREGFMDGEKEARARAFAQKIIREMTDRAIS
jgi:multimeric flavodoxin WrbA